MKKRKHLTGGNLEMSDISKIFKLLIEENNISEISRELGIARSTVREYKLRADGLNLSYEHLSSLSLSELSEKFKKSTKGRKKKEDSKIDLKQISKELLKKGVTKQLLYQEYYRESSDPISYSGFCTRIREYKKSSKLSMKQVYRAGDKYFVDFSGLSVPIYSSGGHFLYKAQIFVATLGLSNYTYVEAVMSQSSEDFIAASVRSISYLKGVPECLVPDNLKAAVIKTKGYEFDLNKTYQELGNYYNTAILPARVRKPQDKAKVETAVKLIQQSILAPIRNERFYSLSELNQRIKPLLEEFNNKEMKSYGYSRLELFNSVEKQALKELPVTPYEMQIWKKAKVHPDYHVSIEDCYYSTPSNYRGKVVDVCVKDKLVEIYDNSNQIAVHKRIKLKEVVKPSDKLKYRFSTNKEHLPPSHEFVSDWTRIGALKLAENIGKETKEFIESIFGKYTYEPQAIRAVMGLPRLKNKYGEENIEMAASIANRRKVYSMSYLTEVLKSLSKQDKAISRIEPIEAHTNIRGSGYYNKH